MSLAFSAVAAQPAGCVSALRCDTSAGQTWTARTMQTSSTWTYVLSLILYISFYLRTSLWILSHRSLFSPIYPLILPSHRSYGSFLIMVQTHSFVPNFVFSNIIIISYCFCITIFFINLAFLLYSCLYYRACILGLFDGYDLYRIFIVSCLILHEVYCHFTNML